MILIVDDDEEARSALCDLLTEMDYEVTSQPGGEEGLSFLRAHPQTDLVFLDLMMPGVDGYDFRQRQLSDSTIAGIPVIVFTAQVGALDKLPEGTHVLRKPASMNGLLRAISDATASQ